ncbi:hypothetical protein PHLGIDRAFT_515350 [Phlebiopsis gigantea 11061_1 CR5-6]|uniref:ABM domain-containing protein n=1 Tax=Phlebiopsis gigantea (strain 11061_1 CR5-6) TaxID=745531 RepID=A0A0C3S6V1_PHLG1|nr:hypothetical protein PHLGIDRAFT_515350 [Phlebiopsis gigantea 11061_1 CR5-6]
MAMTMKATSGRPPIPGIRVLWLAGHLIQTAGVTKRGHASYRQHDSHHPDYTVHLSDMASPSSYPQIEVLKFAVSDAYKQDPAVLNQFLNKIVKAPGVANVWHGPEVQNEAYHYVVVTPTHLNVEWAYKDAPSAYAGIQDALTPAQKEVLYVYYTHFGDANTDAALGAPITELAVADVKADVELARFTAAGNDLLTKLISKLPNEVVPGGRGSVVGEPRKFVVCLGWQSLESIPELVEAVTTLRGLADVDLKHARLSKYTRD